MEIHHIYCVARFLYHYVYIYISCLSANGVCASVGGRKKTTSASCNGGHHHRCKECLHQWLNEKCHQRKLQPVTTTMRASEVLALVDGSITPQAQDAKVRAQGAKVRTEGAKVRTSDQHTAQVGKGCSNNIQLQPPTPLTRTNTAQCSNHCNLRKGL